MKGKWTTTAVDTVGELDGFTPSDKVGLSPYGGRMDRRTRASGFFRTEKIDGRWWFVDPEGYLFLSAGICSVISNNPQQEDFSKSGWDSPEDWAKSTHGLLKSHGFNTLGCWSEWQHFQGEYRLPYTCRWNFMSTFGRKLKVTAKGFGHTDYKNGAMPIFHPEFESFCDEHARQLSKTKDDPWLIGHFSDNELPFRPNLLDLFLALPKDDPGFIAARKWWDEYRAKTRKGPDEERSQEDQDAFLEYVAHRYYSIVGAAIRRHDPNHLYLGSRIHGRCIRPATLRGSRTLDVVSINYYHHWTPKADQISLLAKAAGRPVLMSEWYAMAVPASEEIRGAGFRVKTERDRGWFYQNHTLGLLKHPDCVGWHWFKYSGDDGVKQIGIVDRDYRPHRLMLQSMRELNQQIYPLADFFENSRKGKKPVDPGRDED
ncbi:MAG: hypothetical protein MUF31_16065 [Akkermansiaceae bacterium]|nr:hypothetical protein [Akkermansiaceae bacterium]